MEKKAYFFSKNSIKILKTLQNEGRVHSVFKNSINILTPKKTLLTLLSKEKEIYRNPISIVIDEEDFANWHILPSEKVIYKDNYLVFLNKDLYVNLGNKITWDSSFRYFGPLSPPHAIQKNIETLKFFIKVMKWNKGLLPLVIDAFPQSPFSKKMLPILTEIIENDSIDLNGMEKIIGLGDGLTPSGDDFLSGFLIILYYFGRYLDIQNEINELISQILKEVYTKTTLISATFLTLAAKGEAFFLLREIIKDLLGRRAFDMENIRLLIEYGGTSGASILAGLIFGIDYVLKHLYREIKEVIV